MPKTANASRVISATNCIASPCTTPKACANGSIARATRLSSCAACAHGPIGSGSSSSMLDKCSLISSALNMRVSSNADGPCGFTTSLFSLPNICVASASKHRVSSITSGDSPNAIVSSVEDSTAGISIVFSVSDPSSIGSATAGSVTIGSAIIGSASTEFSKSCCSTGLCN